jgi:hypothetical protein
MYGFLHYMHIGRRVSKFFSEASSQCFGKVPVWAVLLGLPDTGDALSS